MMRALLLRLRKRAMMMMFLLRLRKRKGVKHKLMKVILLQPRRSKKIVPAGKLNTASFWPLRGFVI
jgi:hypothetical protein